MRASWPTSWRASWNSHHLGGLFELVLAISNNQPLFNANLYVIGVSGKTRAVADYNGFADSHWLDQSDTLRQCDLPARHSDYAGGLCLNFVRASVNSYASTRTPALWKFLSNGTGSEVFFGCTHTSSTGTQVRYTTRASGNGVTQYRQSVGATSYFVNDGAVIINVVNPGGTVGVGVPTYSDCSFTSPNWAVRVKGALYASGTQAAVPAGNNPELTLTIGTDGTNHADMRWPFMLSFPFINSSHRSLIQQYIYQDTGMAA